jgi:hypothetical protein
MCGRGPNVRFQNMTESLTHVVVRVESDGDDLEQEELAQQLRRELLDSDVEAVQMVYESASPEGAKAIDGSAIGLAVTVFAAGMPSFVTVLHNWVTNRRPHCVVHLEGPHGAVIEIPNIPLERLNDVIASWPQAPPLSSGEERASASHDEQASS